MLNRETLIQRRQDLKVQRIAKTVVLRSLANSAQVGRGDLDALAALNSQLMELRELVATLHVVEELLDVQD